MAGPIRRWKRDQWRVDCQKLRLGLRMNDVPRESVEMFSQFDGQAEHCSDRVVAVRSNGVLITSENCERLFRRGFDRLMTLSLKLVNCFSNIFYRAISHSVQRL